VYPRGSRLLLAVTLLVLAVTAANGAPLPRLHSANAILVMEPPFPRTAAEPTPIVLYREPGVGRLDSRTFPQLLQTLPRFAATASHLLVPASRRKGEWVRIPYDDAGREGWLRMERGWRLVPWDDFLPGATVRLLTGLKSEFYVPATAPVRSPADSGPSLQNQDLLVHAVRGDWIEAETDAGWRGWCRWRDDDGRLTIDPVELPENR
jgi:hypothetical protein